MTTYGYARVSTNGQSLDQQEAELAAAGCSKVFKAKVSGAKTDRAELAKGVRPLEPGGVVAWPARAAARWHRQRGTCSMCWPRLATGRKVSAASKTPGRTPPLHTAG